jgi:hypothetical protein
VPTARRRFALAQWIGQRRRIARPADRHHRDRLDVLGESEQLARLGVSNPAIWCAKSPMDVACTISSDVACPVSYQAWRLGLPSSKVVCAAMQIRPAPWAPRAYCVR